MQERQRRTLEVQLQSSGGGGAGAGNSAQLQEQTTRITALQSQLGAAKLAAEQQLAGLQTELAANRQQLASERRQSAQLATEVERLTPVKKRKETEEVRSRIVVPDRVASPTAAC